MLVLGQRPWQSVNLIGSVNCCPNWLDVFINIYYKTGQMNLPMKWNSSHEKEAYGEGEMLLELQKYFEAL